MLPRATAAGLSALAALRLVIPAGATATVELELAGPVAADGGYRLDMHRQPFLAPDMVRASVDVPKGWRVGDGERQVKLVSDVHLVTSVRRG